MYAVHHILLLSGVYCITEITLQKEMSEEVNFDILLIREDLPATRVSSGAAGDGSQALPKP